MNAHERLNLFPVRSRAQIERRGWRKLLQQHPAALRVAAGIVVLICLAVAFNQITRRMDPTYLRAKIGELRSTQESLTLQIEDKTNALLARRADLMAKRTTLDDQLRALAQPQRSQSNLSGIVIQLVDIVPESIWVKELQYSNNELSIVGSTENAQAVSEFMRRLDDTNAFQNTVFRYTQREVDEKETLTRYSFEIVTLPVSGPASELQWKN